MSLTSWSSAETNTCDQWISTCREIHPLILPQHHRLDFSKAYVLISLSNQYKKPLSDFTNITSSRVIYFTKTRLLSLLLVLLVMMATVAIGINPGGLRSCPQEFGMGVAGGGGGV